MVAELPAGIVSETSLGVDDVVVEEMLMSASKM